HEYIEHLRRDERPEKPGKLTPEEARAYQMAALFRAATPGAAEPDSEFAAQLRARLEQEVSTTAPQRAIRAVRSRVSRRGLFASGLGAAAAAAVGFAAGNLVDRATEPQANWSTTLIAEGLGTWVAVASVVEIPMGSVRRFTTASTIGFVRHTAEGFYALSGACTHMGCLLNWNGAARTFDCPCHGGRFTEDGEAASSSSIAYRPLPWIQTKVENGQVWVYVAPDVNDAGASTPTPISSDPSGNYNETGH
ncbi:MAG TPA: Rieske (2Fe-2S) protein, partial [Ktedonobacterales bacterium]|nr:Rieske (2Fe-2S) protein [Ktedonobacterales bacterium]